MADWGMLLSELSAPVMDQGARFVIGAELFKKEELATLNRFFRLVKKLRGGEITRETFSAVEVGDVGMGARPLLERLKQKHPELCFFVDAMEEDFSTRVDALLPPEEE